MIGAGIPRARFIEIVGEYSTGKSAFCYQAIGAFQRSGGQCILLDSERKTEKSFTALFGVDWGSLGYEPDLDIKKAIQIIGRVAQTADPKIPTLVAWDSIASTRGSDELEDAVSNEKFTGEMAARARELSASLRAVLGELAKKKVTLIGVNQLRTNFNFMGRTFQESSGGKAIKYHAAARIMLRMKGRIRHVERDLVTGVALEIEMIKNSLAPPFRKATIQLKFDQGFVPYSGLDELLLRHGRLAQKAGWLAYGSRTFRSVDLERIAAEIPALLEPLNGIVERPGPMPESPKEEPVQVPAPDEGVPQGNKSA